MKWMAKIHHKALVSGRTQQTADVKKSNTQQLYLKITIHSYSILNSIIIKMTNVLVYIDALHTHYIIFIFFSFNVIKISVKLIWSYNKLTTKRLFRICSKNILGYFNMFGNWGLPVLPMQISSDVFQSACRAYYERFFSKLGLTGYLNIVKYLALSLKKKLGINMYQACVKFWTLPNDTEIKVILTRLLLENHSIISICIQRHAVLTLILDIMKECIIPHV